MNAGAIDVRMRERLADLAASLVVNCHAAERASSDESDWHDVLAALDDVAVIVLRNRVMMGDLATVARFLVSPMSRVACAMTFLAEVEPYLTAEEVTELRELWEQPSIDKTEHLRKLERL